MSERVVLSCEAPFGCFCTGRCRHTAEEWEAVEQMRYEQLKMLSLRSPVTNVIKLRVRNIRPMELAPFEPIPVEDE